LHTLTAIISLSLLRRLLSGRKVHFLLQLGVFTLIEFNPVLLILSHDILTDCLNVFLFTAFLWALQAPLRFKPFIVSTLLAAMIVVRPFNQSWGAVFFAAYLALWLMGLLFQGRLSGLLKRWSARQFINITIQVCVPLLCIVGLQYLYVYQMEKSIGLVGNKMNSEISLILDLGNWYYKYDTYVGRETRSPSLSYVFANWETRAKSEMQEGEPLRMIPFILENPVESFFFYVIRGVGLFQHYEWSAYRFTTENTFNEVALWGLFAFFGCVYANVYFVFNFKRVFLKQLNQPFTVLLLAVDLYLGAYTLLYVPEFRFIAPTLPIFLVLGVAAIMQDRSWRNIALVLTSSFTLYVFTFEVLRVSIAAAPLVLR